MFCEWSLNSNVAELSLGLVGLWCSSPMVLQSYNFVLLAMPLLKPYFMMAQRILKIRNIYLIPTFLSIVKMDYDFSSLPPTLYVGSLGSILLTANSLRSIYGEVADEVSYCLFIMMPLDKFM